MTSRTQDDRVGVLIGRHGQDHGNDVFVSAGGPRSRDQSGSSSSLHAIGGGGDRGIFGAGVSVVVAVGADHSQAHAQ